MSQQGSAPPRLIDRALCCLLLQSLGALTALNCTGTGEEQAEGHRATPAAEATSPAANAELVAEVRAALDAFADAERARDAAAVVSFLSRDFYMYGDGTRADYENVVRQITETLPTLQRFETKWSNIEVTPLGQNHALVSMIFEDEITAEDGAISRKWGPNTFVWQRGSKGWKILYTDADHYAWPRS